MKPGSSAGASLFGRVRLGYVLAESRKRLEWHRFGVEALGLHADMADDGALAFRIDGHQRRLIVREGPAEDVIALGWQLDNEDALQTALQRLRARGVVVEAGTAGEAALRGVAQFWGFTGPKRLQVELFIAPILTPLALSMRASGFVTGAGGMGHVAITTREPESMQAFWREVFDARLSDHIEERLNGLQLELTFLRLNERHHSVATAATRGMRLNTLRTQLHHLNLQTASLDDVTEGYRRCRELGYKIASAIGQHPNDRELSFYVASPSGFEIELGWNPIVVNDDEEWTPSTYQGISLWGHYPESLTAGGKLKQLGRGLLSLSRAEYWVGGKT